MSEAPLRLWPALRARLQATPALGLNRVFDGPPRNAVFPYVALDSQEMRDRSGVDAALSEHRVTLKVFSRKGGQTEVAELAATVADALVTTPIAVTGHRIICLRVASLEHRLQRDALTAEATVRLVIPTEPIA